MSRMREKDRTFGLLKKLSKPAIVAAAAACLLGVSLGWPVDRPAQPVLAETGVTPTVTSGATPLPATSEPTVSPSPTPRPTKVATEPAPSPTPSPTGTPGFRVVQAGETLTGIARTYGVSAEELVLLNELTNPDLVYVGQRLALPRSVDGTKTLEPSPTEMPVEPTPSPAPASGQSEERWIDVDISEQRLTAYEGETLVRTTLVSTGLPNTPTPLGQFRIWIKFRYDDMAGADYYIEDVPYVMYFHEGYGLHGVTWHGNFGHPMSHGCVNLPTPEAAWLFEWAEVDTLVNVHE